MKKIRFNENWIYNGKTVSLPHDAMPEAGRKSDSPGGSASGFFVGGEYIYEKKFTAPKEWAGRHILLQFEGVYKNSTVYVNGKAAGGAAYGYIPFFVCLDGLLEYGRENTVRVVADNKDLPNARWYTGGGIYRPVWLWEGAADAIEPESVQISTVSIDPAVIRVQSPKIVTVTVGAVSGSGTDFTLTVPEAKLWSEDAPNLYTAHVTNGSDSEDIRFGIRKVTWDKTGLYVNGKRTLLRGGCVHHDNGLLGAAAYDGAEYRRVKIMKEAGYNAIRSAHNPCSRAMLEACDELGVYMMDETWDMWFHHKSKFDYASDWCEHHENDIRALVKRDFNHPSVILYSIGNEVSEPAKDEGVEAVRRMTELIHSLDPNRAVTGGFNLMIISSAKKGKGIYDDEQGGRKNDGDNKMQGMNSTMYNFIASMVGTGMNKSASSKSADLATSPALDLLDVAGYNYASGRYPLEGKAHPDRIIFGSETFPQDIAKNWDMVKKYPYLVGDFMWTAWDYLGEAGIGAWAYTDDGRRFNKPYPWLLADCGAIDILGNPGVPVALAQAAWGLDRTPWVGVQPVNHPGVKVSKSTWRGSNAIASWAWHGCEGNKAVVEIYSSAPVVELWLNGKKLGRKKTKLCKATFKTKYAAGKLEAVSYGADGRELGRTVLSSAQEKLHIETSVEAYGDLKYIAVSLADGNGTIECNADEELTVKVEGGELLGFGSANPRTEESYQSGEFKTYYGRALAIVRGEHAEVTISGENMASVKVICG